MSLLDKWKDKIARNIGDKLDMLKLNLIDKVSGIVGYIFYALVALFTLLTIFLFSGLGLSEVLADALNSRAGGYFATAGIFAVLMAALFLFRKKLVEGFAGIIIGMLTMQDDDKDDEPTEETHN